MGPNLAFIVCVCVCVRAHVRARVRAFSSIIYFLLSSFIHPFLVASFIYSYFFFFTLPIDALKHSTYFLSFVTGMMNQMLAPLAHKLKTT
jgi:hypothetical protein